MLLSSKAIKKSCNHNSRTKSNSAYVVENTMEQTFSLFTEERAQQVDKCCLLLISCAAFASDGCGTLYGLVPCVHLGCLQAADSRLQDSQQGDSFPQVSI